jgi:drug/metabolite transporter (DMT)-like permease
VTVTQRRPAEPPAWTFLLAFFIIYVAWGTTYWVIRRAVSTEGMPPALFGGLRLLSAGLVLLAYQTARGRSLRVSRSELLRLFGVSCLLFLLANWFVSLAMTGPDAHSAFAAVLIATTPLWLGLFESAWPGGERLSWLGWLGLIVGLAGVLLLLAPRLGDPAAFFSDYPPLLLLASAAAWALGSLFLRYSPTLVPHLTSAGYQMLLGGGCQFLVGLTLGEQHRLPEALTVGVVWTFLYLLVVGSLLGFVAYNWLLGYVSAAKVGTYAYVNPAVAVLIGWVAGEPITGGLLAGIGVILAGVYLVRADHRPLPPSPSPD